MSAHVQPTYLDRTEASPSVPSQLEPYPTTHPPPGVPTALPDQVHTLSMPSLLAVAALELSDDSATHATWLRWPLSPIALSRPAAPRSRGAREIGDWWVRIEKTRGERAPRRRARGPRTAAVAQWPLWPDAGVTSRECSRNVHAQPELVTPIERD